MKMDVKTWSSGSGDGVGLHFVMIDAFIRAQPNLENGLDVN